MNVRCEECGTIFNLEEERVKPSGSKARCSVCENIFIIYPLNNDNVSNNAENKEKEEEILQSPSNKKFGLKIFFILILIISVVMFILEYQGIINIPVLDIIVSLFK